MKLLSDIFLIIGALFCLLGALGLLRMPDVYNRIQAGAKAVTLGSLALLLGVGFAHPDWWPKLLVVGLFILLTNPIGSSTLARAFHRSGVPLWHKQRDES
ncbi:MAG: monovalent cation/H(+) antiporter subunit G [Chromatiaceae bacterium]|nr:monovalent cation/H(+) antiporter subunit G [Chromatiaceae bacterium]HPE80817.1 monovalent cation/H(+) antiporter subunit G [Gammaproteobacteria bacterium]